MFTDHFNCLLVSIESSTGENISGSISSYYQGFVVFFFEFLSDIMGGSERPARVQCTQWAGAPAYS